MDIRKYFTAVGSSKKPSSSSSAQDRKKKKKHIIEDSDEEDPIPRIHKKPKVIVLDSDDDEDDDMFKIKKTPEKKKKELPKSERLHTKPKSPPLKLVSVEDFFSSAPIKKKESKSISVKRKKNEDASCHSDDDFEKTLNQLDEQKCNTKKAKHEIKGETIEYDSSNTAAGKSSLSEVKEECKHSPSAAPGKSFASKLSKLKQVDKIYKDKSPKDLEGSPDFSYKEKKPNVSESSTRKSEHVKNEKEVAGKVKEDSNIKHERGEKIPVPTSGQNGHVKQKSVSPEKKEKKKSGVASPSDGKVKQKGSGSSTKPTESPMKTSENLDDSVVEGTPDPNEKRKQSALAYKKFLQRAGPSNPGSKPIPEGEPGCLEGLTFVITGVMESLDREEAAEIIKRYGGKVTTSVSRNTSYLLVGDDPGQSKLKKAEQLNTKQIVEDDLLELLRTRPGKGDKLNPDIKKSSKVGLTEKFSKFEAAPAAKKVEECQKMTSSVKKKKDSPEFKYLQESPKPTLASFSPKTTTLSQSSTMSSMSSQSSQSTSTQPLSSQDLAKHDGEMMMWVDKYKPVSVKNIIGQQGEKSNVKKLIKWLTNWHSNHNGNKKLTRPSPWAKDDDGAFFKTALLSGPPGVGKTTTAHLVCKELGFDAVELNASDTRSKRSMEEMVSQLIGNKSLSGFVQGQGGKTTNLALVMDEVDGMSGNEDRGGVQELIGLIKQSKIPIICMCNDRNHPKIRSLANYCFDLRFSKPRLEQIKGPMMSICYRENIKIKPDALEQIVIGANQDVRQILHHLSVWSANQKNLEVGQMKTEAQKAKKDMKMGPWDVAKKVFSEADHRNMSLYDRSDLFFHDYSIGPLFVQENYPKVMPHAARGDRKALLNSLSKTAAILADGDLVEKTLRSYNAWSLLPTQAVFSSVLPGYYMSGHLTSQIEFPRWLGNNSRRNKFDRLMQEIQVHMRLKISGNKLDVGLDYSPMIRNAVTTPLSKKGQEGVPEAVNALNSYDLQREDLDAVIELSQWPGKKDPMASVDSKVKAAFTRAYNKDPHLNPYSVVSTIKKKAGRGASSQEGEEEEDEEEDEEEEDDIGSDAMIKKRTKGEGKQGGNAGTSTRGRGRGGGRGRGRGK
ncbi:germ line transcription factor 1 isoform X2 [Oratosquilla oratoria]|uniref:germ line transcription factor 1 isoform X2 n=1 Tax=Oratosquilla oratoria TaxID=337810 RepID=UPI003F766AE2